MANKHNEKMFGTISYEGNQIKTTRMKKITTQKDVCPATVTAALSMVARTREQPKCPAVEKWTKRAAVHIHNRVPLSHEKEQTSTAGRSSDAPRDCRTERREAQETNERHCLHVEPKERVQVSSFTKQKQSHRGRKQTYHYQRIEAGGINWETGIDTDTLLSIQNMKADLLHSPGNCTP